MAECMIAVICGIVLIALLSAVFDSNRFVTRTYEIRSKKLTKPCKFVLLADLHNKSFGKENHRLLSAIEEISPDGILVAGDMLTAEKGADFSHALSLMERLAKSYPVYYGMGNHEYRLGLYPEQYPGMYEGYIAGLKKAGIEPLINEAAYLPAWNISVCGAQIDRYYYKHLRRAPMESFYHVHGGIMRLPFLGGVLSPSLTLFPRYDGGLFREYGSTMILSRGLSSHTIPIRIFNPGELIVIDLMPDKH